MFNQILPQSGFVNNMTRSDSAAHVIQHAKLFMFSLFELSRMVNSIFLNAPRITLRL